jgi:hypothetical protein
MRSWGARLHNDFEQSRVVSGRVLNKTHNHWMGKE